MLSFLLISLAAFCNSIMDVTSFHYEQSYFIRFNPKYWNPQYSWKNKYVNGDPKQGRTKIMQSHLSITVAFTDSWHLFKSIMVICLCGAVVLYKPVTFWYCDFLIAGFFWNITFNTFYKWLS